MIHINHAMYGVSTEFSTIEEAQQAIRSCGREFEKTILHERNGEIFDENENAIGNSS